eukprot:405116_1
MYAPIPGGAPLPPVPRGAPMPGTAPLPAPPPWGYYGPAPMPAPLPSILWHKFVNTLGRQPNTPKEFQEYTFFNLTKGKKKFITYLDAYCEFITHSTADRIALVSD